MLMAKAFSCLTGIKNVATKTKIPPRAQCILAYRENSQKVSTEEEKSSHLNGCKDGQGTGAPGTRLAYVHTGLAEMRRLRLGRERRRGRIFEQHPHEALENGESYKLPDLGANGMWFLIGCGTEGGRRTWMSVWSGLWFRFCLSKANDERAAGWQLQQQAGASAPQGDEGETLFHICLHCLDDGPIMWLLMAFAQFLATILIVWAALDSCPGISVVWQPF